MTKRKILSPPYPNPVAHHADTAAAAATIESLNMVFHFGVHMPFDAAYGKISTEQFIAIVAILPHGEPRAGSDFIFLGNASTDRGDLGQIDNKAPCEQWIEKLIEPRDENQELKKSNKERRRSGLASAICSTTAKFDRCHRRKLVNTQFGILYGKMYSSAAAMIWKHRNVARRHVPNPVDVNLNRFCDYGSVDS